MRSREEIDKVRRVAILSEALAVCPMQANARDAAFIAAEGMNEIRFDDVPGLQE